VLGNLLSLLCSFLLIVLGTPLTTAVAAEHDAELTIEQYVTDHQDEVPAIKPGDRFSFTVNVQCSSPDTGACVGATIVDELPEPLEFDSDPMSITPNIASASVSGRTLTTRFNGTGFEAGILATLTIKVVLPTTASGDFDAKTVRNQVTANAANADAVTDATAVKLAIPTTLAARATTSATPDQTLPALPGRAATFTLKGGNASNVSVDSLQLSDPAGAGASTFDYLAVTGLAGLDAPRGATKVRLDWYDGHDWHNGTAVALPEDPDDLLPANPDQIRGLRITFSGTAGGIIPPGASGGLTVKTVSRDAFGDLAAEETLQVTNPLQVVVVRGADTAADQASASVTFQKKPVQVAVTKTFTTDSLVSGSTTTATVTATTGIMPVSRLELTEPAAGHPDLAAQGLTFVGFVTDPAAERTVAWPSGATRAEVTYRYTEGDPQTLDTTDVDTLPDPDADRVVTGFTVVFTGADDAIDSRARAVLPFRVRAGQVDQEAGVGVTNAVNASVTSSTPDSATDTATADLALLPQRVRASTSKVFSRSSTWATPGTTNTVSITSRLTQGSTVGSGYLQVEDSDAAFWDYFDLRRVQYTDIPANTDLTVTYWDGTDWRPLAGPVAGPVSDWSFTPTDVQRAAIAGLRFTYTPKTSGDLLSPGFNVAPRFDVTLRRALRSEPGVATTGSASEVAISDTATTEVANPVAIQQVVTASSTATTTLKPTGTGGAGGGSLWMVTKRWLDPVGGDPVGAANVSALSDSTRTAVLAWGTDGLSLSQLEIVDDPAYASPASSFHDAFDLVRIRPITRAIDPEIGQDRVSGVALYSSSAGDWVDITSKACPTASACDGGFPGYTLTDAERASTLAVRLTFAPGSASDTGAIALSSGADRQVRLDYQLRRTLRSDPARYVLGDSHAHTYNSPKAGTVVNHVQATGTLTEPDEHENTAVRSEDTADLTILDQPLNVSLAKTLDQVQLGLPQADTTAAEDYPLVRSTLVAINNTASHVPELAISDPSPAQTGLGAYDRLNLYQIQLPELPADLTAADVTVDLRTADEHTRTYSADEALALTPAQLADVVGVTVHFGAQANLADPDAPLVASGETATAQLTYQLRSTLRSDPATPVTDGDTVTNTARAEVRSPGGIACAGSSDCDQPTADDDASLSIVQPTYSVSATKSINWPTRYEDQSATGYVVTLTAQPDGTARTRQLSLTDAEPTFWNAFSLASVQSITVPKPITELRLSVLTGVGYTLVDGTLVARCDGDADLSDCWRPAAWATPDGDGRVTLTLPGGVSAGDVRGVRIEAQRTEGGQVLQWERPANPLLVVRLNLTRRQTLVLGVAGATDTPVPTTRKDQPVAPGETAAGTTTDAATVTGVAGWMQNTAPYAASATASATTVLQHRPNQVKVEKLPGMGTGSLPPRYDLDATIPYELRVTNTGSWSMTGLRLADHIDLVGDSSPLVPASVATPFSAKVDGITDARFTFALDEATGDLAIGVPSGFVLKPASVLLITANLRFRDRLERGTVVTNTLTVGSDRPFEKCQYTDQARLQPTTVDVADCVAGTTVVTAASTPMTVTTSVKGDGAGVPGATAGDPHDDDLGVVAVGSADASDCVSAGADGFYSYPCTPITRPGGRETWQLSVANNGNIGANVISAIDVLPAPGDTGVTVGTARKSRFSPTLLGNVRLSLPDGAAAHSLQAFYTTAVLGASCNKADILNDTRPAPQDDCDIDWHEFDAGTDPAALAGAKAVKFLVRFDDPADGLAPGEKLTVRFDTRTPAYADLADSTTGDPVAWNSAAVGSRTSESESFAARASLVTEPRKVGVAIAGGRLDLAKLVVAPEGATWRHLLPDSYDVTLACTSLGESVPLRGSSSSVDASGFSLAADGTVLHYNGTDGVNLPLGAECSVTEKSVQGAETTYAPASAIAGRSYADVPNVAHGYTADTVGRLDVTNTYRNAGFTVGKAVSGPRATYADGTDVRFKDFTFTASCTFAGSEVVPEAERTFSLREGDETRFDGLPAGAECTVTETYAAGAARTTIKAVQAGEEVAAGTTSVDFTLLAGESPATGVDVANTYTVGAVQITKELTGAGAAAWADGTFEAQLVCTSADADPATVYSAIHPLTRTEPTWDVTGLPTGATCTVTETRTGGANASTVSGGTFTVGDDPAKPASVTLTNRFAEGSVQVTKRVLANGQPTTAGPWADGEFPVTLACTRPVDGVPQAIAIPGDATRTLTAANHWTATYSGLPTGATCSATEGATALTPAQPEPEVTVSAPVVVGDATTAAITVTNDYPAGTLAVHKQLTGVGTGFFTVAAFDVSCTLDGYDDPVFARSGVQVTAAALTTAALGPIPFGASCTVTETATGGADATPPARTVTIEPNAATSDLTTVEFSNAFSAGTVTITKTLAGEAKDAAWATGASFTFAVKCGLAASGPYSYAGDVTLKGGQSVQLKDAGGSPRLFPVGTHCWASETATGGAVTPSVDQDSFEEAVVVAAAPGSVQALTISATNSYTYAGFTVTKDVVTSGATDANGTLLVYTPTFTFTVSCTLGGTTWTRSDTFTLARQGDGTWPSKAYDHLPTGATCTVTETGRAGATSTTVRLTRAGVTGDPTTTSTTSFSLAAGDATATTVAFTNTYGVGRLQLVKKLSPASPTWATAPFTLHVECTAAGFIAGTVYSKDFTVARGALTIPEITMLPTGASCKTTEAATANGGANSTTYTGQTMTIGDGTVVTTTVTNTFTTGSVAVTKALRVNGQATTKDPWNRGSYTITLHCTRTVNGAAETLTVPAATQVFTGAASYTWTGLPTGATCWATEDAIAYPVDTPEQPIPSTVAVSPTTVSVGTGTAAQTVTNNFANGGVQIVKQLTGEAAAAYASGTFSFDVACTLAGSTGNVFTSTGNTLKRTGAETTLSTVVNGVPQGAVCTVTEAGTGGATSITPATKSVVLDPIVAGSNQVATFANEFRYGGFTVTKTVLNGGAVDASGAPISYGGSYGFTASCLFNGIEVLTAPADRTFTLTGGGSKQFRQLPSGASCTVTETDTRGAVDTSVAATSGETTLASGAKAVTFSVPTGDETAASVAFTNRYATGGLDITKAVAGDGAALWGGGSFTVGLVCTLDHDADAGTAALTVYDASRSLRKGETWPVRNLPAGARCTVSEPQAGGANSTTYANQTPTITAANQQVTVTNTFDVGTVRVTKVLQANGAGTSKQPWASGTFPVTLSCTKDFDGDGTAEQLTISDATKTITGAGTASWANLPRGALCTVTEGTSVVTGQPQPAVSVSGAVTVAATQQTLALTNNFTAGTLVVHKDITGDGVVWGTGPFSFSVDCTLAGVGPVFTAATTLTPAVGQTSLDSSALGPIPIGSVCAVTETATAGATSVTTPDPVTIALDAATGNVTTVGVVNTFRNAGFTVTKSVTTGGAKDASGAAIGYRAAAFTASCTFRGAEVVPLGDRSFSLAAGQSKHLAGLPAGAACTVTETDAAGAASTTTGITQAGSPVADADPAARAAGFTLVPGELATDVEFRNAYTTGSVTIAKALDGSGASRWADPQFTVRLVCTLADATGTTVFDGSHTISVAQPWTVEGLPTGASCAVTETASGAANAKAITNGSFTVGTGTASVTVRNTYTLGTVRVTKHLQLNGAATSAAPWTDGSYTVQLVCTRPVNGVDTPIDIPGGATRRITGAGTADFTDLPTGATCAVSEVASSPASQRTTVSPATVVVGTDPASPQAVTVTNDFHTATMAVRKQLSGAGSAAFGSGPFDFDVSCTLAGAGTVFETTVRLARAEDSAASLDSAALGPVPVGAVCTVTETGRGGADGTPDPVTVTIAEDAATNVAAFTNQFSAGTVWLAKHLSGAAAAEPWATSAEFVIDVRCEVEVAGERGTVLSRRVTIAGGQRVNVTDAAGHPSRVPLGAHCWATEVDPQSATASEVAQDGYEHAAVVAAGSPSDLQVLDLDVTNTYEYAGFTVAKTVDNGGATDEAGDPVGYGATYDFAAECTLNGASVFSRTFTLTDGTSRAFDGLPAGASCTVTEIGTGHAVRTLVQVVQNDSAGAAETSASAGFVLQRGTVSPDSPAANRVGFTNAYRIGASTLAKVVAGDGAAAWGEGPFALHVVCTLDTDADPATAPATVFDATREVTRGEPEWALTELPSGASCTVTETATGGATAAAEPAVFTVGTDPGRPARIELTNRFDTGAVTVTKSILVDGETSAAEPYASADYLVKLDCTREVNGVARTVDVPGDAAAAGEPGDGLRSITGAGTVTYGGLPTGAVCTTTEVAAGLSLPADQVSIDHGTVTVPAGDTVAVEVTNDYHTGALVLTKALAGAGAGDYADRPFGFDVSCTLTDTRGVAHTVFTASGLELSRDGGLTGDELGPIPVGASCTVVETRTGGATTPAPGATAIITDGAATPVVLTNTFATGELRVRLQLTLDGTPTTADPYAGGRYTTRVSCTREVDGEDVAVPVPGGADWTSTGAGERTIGGLPVGARCAVVQTDASLAPQGVGYDPAAAVVTGTGPATLTVVDDFTTSTLTVRKVLAGAGAAVHADQPFGFTVTCTLAEDGVATPHRVFGQSLTLSRATGLASGPLGPVPVGAECTVVETASGGATVAADAVTVRIEPDPAANAATLTNTFGTGTITLQKVLTVDGEPTTAEPYASGTYTVRLDCTRVVDGRTEPVTVPGGATRTITGAGSVDVTGLPIGATCAVSEPASSLAIPADQVSISPAVVTVGATATTARITNDFRSGTLGLRWRLAGVGVGFAGSASFSVSCTLAGAEGPVFAQDLDLTPVPGQAYVDSGQLGPIPIGASCTVTEHSADGADHVAAPVTVTGDVTAVQVEVVNQYSAGTVTVVKQLDGPGAADQRHTRFRFLVTCAAGSDETGHEVEITGTGSVTVADGSGQPLLLPAGTRCWAEETDAGGAVGSTVDHGSSATALEVTTGDAATVQQLTITVTNRFAATAAELAWTGFEGWGIAFAAILCIGVGAWLLRIRSDGDA
jgi:hypothetical protein